MNRKILALAIPSIIANITTPLLGLVDTAIVGHMGNAVYIGAIAVGGVMFNMLYWLFGFLRGGTSGLTAQAYGAGSRPECALVLYRSLTVAAGVGIAMILLQWPLGWLLQRFIDPDPATGSLAIRYFTILIYGAPAVLGTYALSGWFLGMQNARYPMYLAIVQNLVNIIASKEDILYKALRIDPARLRWCQKTNEKLIEAINRRKPQTMEALKDIWYAGSTRGRDEHYNDTRYHGLNLHSTFTKGTVEFRLFNSTTHAGEIKAYIQFCLAVSHQALTQKKASARKTVTDNEKYAFRCWMLRLGLSGDEFKTCRLHFLKHLEGNSAWRNAA